MSKSNDVKVRGVKVYFIPVGTRVPLKFGKETLTEVTLLRVMVRAESGSGVSAEGWGETPLSVQWVWPSPVAYSVRNERLMSFAKLAAAKFAESDASGHPMEIGSDFIHGGLARLLEEFNRVRKAEEKMPHLASLVAYSAFDIALHDAYGKIHGLPAYETYNSRFMNRDLSSYLTAADGSNSRFAGKYPCDFLDIPGRRKLRVWHLVGGLDPIGREELKGDEPDDGYPILLKDWIERDGLKCLKIKLRGNDAAWDYERLVKVGAVAVDCGVEWLTTDFNCTVTEPAYVNDILDRLVAEHPRIYGMILYVEQPFPYDLEQNRIDVHSVSARKPLFMDESAHDWSFVKLGHGLGWTGVALKTCKSQTGALLSLCWAKAHGMTLMVQDLTNPMLAQIPHVQLAAHAGTIMGVESNAMQFYPEASRAEAQVHPGLYLRRNGVLDLSTLKGSGFGYRLDEIRRELPEPAVVCGSL